MRRADPWLSEFFLKNSKVQEFGKGGVSSSIENPWEIQRPRSGANCETCSWTTSGESHSHGRSKKQVETLCQDEELKA